MATIKEILSTIEEFAPRQYQEDYDNAKLITGHLNWICSGVLVTLDSTEEVVDEAIDLGCNLIIAHHPILFSGLKQLTGKTYVERTIIKAIKNDIAIYACHTNIDNVWNGVNRKIADKIGLKNNRILLPKPNTLSQLVTFVPAEHANKVRQAIFSAGAGNIGNYSDCSFNVIGTGTFLGNEDSDPQHGEKGVLEKAEEVRIEVILPTHKQAQVLRALKESHPYEEVAYYLTPLLNTNQEVGSGIIGELTEPMDENQFLMELKTKFKVPVIRHTKLLNQKIKKVAVCGGAGSFLVQHAIAQQADIFITADMKYHEFFDADNQLIIADIGHYESEQYTSELFKQIIQKKYSTFAVHFSMTKTNPINYL